MSSFFLQQMMLNNARRRSYSRKSYGNFNGGDDGGDGVGCAYITIVVVIFACIGMLLFGWLMEK